MTALLGFIFSNPTVLAIGAAIIGAAVAWMHGRVTGAAAERHKQAAAEVKARDISDAVQNDVGALPPDAARKEIGTWDRSKP